MLNDNDRAIGDYDTLEAKIESQAKDLVNLGINATDDFEVIATPDDLITEMVDHPKFEEVLQKAMRFDGCIRELAQECAHRLLSRK